MWTRHHKRRNTGKLIVPLIALIVLSYFGFHAYQGDFGLNAKATLEARIVHLEHELAVLEDTRAKLEERLSLLQDGSLEKDMLDEQIRRALILVRENEIVILRRPSRNEPNSG